MSILLASGPILHYIIHSPLGKKGSKMPKENSGATAWVVNFTAHDYSKALEIPEIAHIKPVTNGYVPLGSIDRVWYEVYTALKDSAPDDFLLLSGLALLNSMASIVFWHLHNHVNALIWDKKTSSYRTTKMSVDQLAFIEDYE